MDGEAIFVTGRGGEGQGQKSMGQGEEPPPPHSAGRGGEGVKICGAERGRAGNILCVSADWNQMLQQRVSWFALH